MSPTSSNVLSFEGRAKKLDSGEDASDFAEEILASGDIEVLQMNGNTVGRKAADVLRDALKQKGSLKRLIWHDIFTGKSSDIHFNLGSMSFGFTIFSLPCHQKILTFRKTK